MSEQIKQYYFNVRKHLINNKNKIVIPLRVLDELKKHSLVKENIFAVSGALNFIKLLKDDDLLQVVGSEEDENFVDNLLLKEITGLVMKKKILLITQDRKLGRDVINLNNRESVRNTNPVNVKRLNAHGYLSRIDTEPSVSR